MEIDKNNIPFSIAATLVHYSNYPLFVTGKAGTGKTTFLKYIHAHTWKKMAIAAPTGIAAMNAGGVTLHSLFYLPFGVYIPHFSSGWQAQNGPANIYNQHQLLGNLKLGAAKRKLLNELELLVIDEISMVRADTLDAIDAILKFVRNNPQPFGGVQVLFLGDLFQLPPVLRNEEASFFFEEYNSPYFFDAKALQHLDLVKIELNKIYRQTDETFIRILNRIRNNALEQEDASAIQERYFPTFEPNIHDGIITLTTHNATAYQINNYQLSQIPSNAVTIPAQISGEFPQSAYPMESELELKEGAQVMFIKNDKGETRQFYNGKIGYIEKIDVDNQCLFVRCPNEENLILVPQEVWYNIRYEFNEDTNTIEEKELGSFAQYPIRLAWAITVHKSQGLTFEHAVVDVGRAFAPGQVYVALSRLRSLKGLFLKTPLTAKAIFNDERIVDFSSSALSEEDLLGYYREVQQDFLKKYLPATFQFQAIFQTLENCLSLFPKGKKEVIEQVYQTLLSIQGEMQKTQEVGLQFLKAIQPYVYNYVDHYSYLEERCRKAVAWFSTQLEALLNVLQKQRQELGTASSHKKYHKMIAQLDTLIRLRIKEINGVLLMFN